MVNVVSGFFIVAAGAVMVAVMMMVVVIVVIGIGIVVCPWSCPGGRGSILMLLLLLLLSLKGHAVRKKNPPPRLGSQVEDLTAFGYGRITLVCSLTHFTDPRVAILTSRPSRATHVEKPTEACPQ